MSHDVRVTTTAPAPTRPQAVVETGRSVLVVVPAAAVLAAVSPATRHTLADAAGLPWAAVLGLARDGVPLVVSGATNGRAAEAEALRLSAALGQPVVPLAGAGVGGVLGGLAAALAGAGTAVLAPAVGVVAALLDGSGWLALGPLVLGGGLVSTGVLLLTSAGARMAGRSRAAREAAAAHHRHRGDVWQALAALRRASLAAELPVAVQADLWAGIDQAEEALLAGADPTTWTATLRQALAALGQGRDVAMPPEQLLRIAERAHAAARELNPGTRA